ncbi:alkaline phosphatase PhoX [Sphaerisporangium sp. NPDC051017]|uniref:alkaline phosphatase PhoX n=1 Tax=Sphaerisporangium sp. NPDC051017 TaxID=3154636 RepID=UPI0034380352
MPSRVRTVFVGATAVVASLALPTASFADHDHDRDKKSSVSTGPTTTVSPYVLPVANGVSVTSLLTVGDKPAGNGYRMVGIPDGLGAYRSGRDLTVYMNQELGATSGIVRAHGQKGAFVSKLRIDARTGAVKSGSDLITSVKYWDYPGQTWGSAPVAPAGAAAGTHVAAFNRFCSGALTDPGQLFNRRTGKGYYGRVYFANEEGGDESRAFGVTADGQAVQLPRLGLFSWENTLAAENKTDTTLVLGNEDGGSGQIRVYAGRKQSSGSPVEKAGLTNGTLGVIDVASHAVATDAEFRAKYGKNAPVKVTVNQLDWTVNGKQQNIDAEKAGLSLNRIEDGAFDPNRPNDYYFVTTAGGDSTPAQAGVPRNGGGLWRLRFADIERPEKGGTLTLLLDGSEAPYLNMPDNIAIDHEGNLLLQEDPGNNPHISRVLAYRIKDGALGVLAQFDPKRFAPNADPASFLTTDEESSGIIDASDLLGEGTFLLDAQVHTAKGLAAGTGPGTVEEYVENGQLLTLTVKSWKSVYAAK